MPCDAIHYKYIVDELSFLINNRVEKITALNNTDVLFSINCNKNIEQLLISINPQYSRILVLKNKLSTKVNSSNSFFSHLKKHLSGSIIKDIVCEKNERIIKITFDTSDELGVSATRTLVAELMGRRSNMLLLNEGNIITDCMYKASLDMSRPILPHMPYVALTSNAEYIEKLNNLSVLVNTTTYAPCVVYLNDICVDFCFCDNIAVFCNIKNQGNTVPTIKNMSSLCNALEYYFDYKIKSTQLANIKQKLLTAIKASLKKLLNTKNNLQLQIEKSSDCEQSKLYGELLTAYMYMAKYGCSDITVLNYYDNQMITIPLDKTISASQNAQRYYKQYAKKQRTLINASQQLDILSPNIEYHNNLLITCELSTQETIDDLVEELIARSIIPDPTKKSNQTTTLSEPRKLIVDKYTVYIGKNNLQNDQLVRWANSTDMWLHASQIAGCHAIIKPLDRTKPIPLSTITKVAQLVAYYTKPKSYEKLPIDYCPIKNVSKPKNSPPGKVVFINQKTLWVTPLLITDK